MRIIVANILKSVRTFWSKLEQANKISLLALAVTIAFPLLYLYKGCQRDEQIDKTNRELKAISFLPRIRIIGPPSIKNFEFDTTHVRIKFADFFKRDTTDEIPTFKLNARVTLTLNLGLTNVGNALVHLQG